MSTTDDDADRARTEWAPYFIILGHAFLLCLALGMALGRNVFSKMVLSSGSFLAVVVFVFGTVALARRLRGHHHATAANSEPLPQNPRFDLLGYCLIALMIPGAPLAMFNVIAYFSTEEPALAAKIRDADARFFAVAWAQVFTAWFCVLVRQIWQRAWYAVAAILIALAVFAFASWFNLQELSGGP